MTKGTKATKPDQVAPFSAWVNLDQFNKVRSLAYWDRRTIGDIVNAAFSEYLEAYETEHGKIKTATRAPAGRGKGRAEDQRADKVVAVKVRASLLGKIRGLAAYKRQTVTETTARAFALYLEAYETRQGKISPAPPEYIERLERRGHART